MPIPATRRHRSSWIAEDEAAIAKVARAYQIREAVKIALRPNRSATRANAAVPTKRPRKVAAAKVAWSLWPSSPAFPSWNSPARTNPGEM
jgi:hypothetical protein